MEQQQQQEVAWLAMPAAELQSIVDYLQHQPWGEVNALMRSLSAAKPVRVHEPPQPPASEGEGGQ